MLAPNNNKSALLKAEKELKTVKSRILSLKKLIAAEKKKPIPNKLRLAKYSRQLKTLVAKRKKLAATVASLKKKIAEEEKKANDQPTIVATPVTPTVVTPVVPNPVVDIPSVIGVVDPNLKYKNAVRKMNDYFPVLFLPVRIETRFIKSELLIRVFPDEIFVKNHEKELTTTELNSVTEFWTGIHAADQSGDSEEEKLQQKRNVASQILIELGKERAAWAIKVTQPKTLLSDDLFGEAPLFNENLPTITASVKSEGNEDESWTRAAYTDVLPERFSFCLYDTKGELEINEFGNKIPANVQIGYDPNVELVDGQNYQEEIKWLFDFDEAVKKGLGIRIKLSKKQLVRGFSKLTVVGLKSDKNITASQSLIKDLFENHQFKVNGMGLIDIGTPTKNVDYEELEVSAPRELDAFIENNLRGVQSMEEDGLTSDAEVLAEALGLSMKDLANVENLNKTDLANSQEMGKILWSSTMGYYLDQFSVNTFTKTRDTKARSFYLNHVSGRGTLPSIRIDDQAYGISPMSDFSRWKDTPGTPTFGDGIFGSILGPLYDHIFKPIGNSKSNTSGDPLAKLSHQASSKTYSARTILGKEVVKGLIETLQKKVTTVPVVSALKKIGIEVDHIPDIINYSLESESTVLTGPVVDSGKTFSNRTLQDSPEHGGNFIHLLFDARSFDDIIKHKFGGKILIQQKDSLLYLYVRYAYLREAVKSSLNYLEPKKLANAIAILDTEFVKLRASNQLSTDMIDYMKLKQERIVKEDPKFQSFVKGLQPNQPLSPLSALSPTNKKKADSFISGEVNKKVTSESKIDVADSKWDYLNNAYPTISGKLSMGDFLFNQMDKKKKETRELIELRAALGNLKDVNVRELENLFSEHIDLSSHRIDAWLLGVVNERLTNQRKIKKYSEGSYIGAYGFVENLKRGKGSGNDPMGFIHAPSRDQAKTSAIVRSSFKEIIAAMTDSPEVNNLSIDISSERMKKAIELIEGINNGQDVSALLGFLFERSLREKDKGQYILDFRKKYGTVSSLKDSDSPSYSTYATVDGRKLVEDFQAGSNVFSGITISNTDKTKVREALLLVDDILDAFSDLLHVESIYQIVKGNYSGLSAVLKSLNNFDHIPKTDFLNTQIHGLRHENRVILTFSGSGSSEKWSNTATYKSNVNPWVNEWLDSVLPDLNKIYVHVEGNIALSDGSEASVDENISMGTLFKGQPIDFCANLASDNKLKQDFLGKLVKLHLASEYEDSLFPVAFNELSVDVKNIPGTEEDSYSLYEVDFIVQQANFILREGRDLKQEDLLIDSENIEIKEEEEVDRSVLTEKLGIISTVISSNITELESAVAALGQEYNESKRSAFLNLYKSLMNQSIQINLMGIPGISAFHSVDTHKALLNFAKQYLLKKEAIREQILSKNTESASLEDLRNLLSSIVIQGEYVTLPFKLKEESALKQSFENQKFKNVTDKSAIHDWLYTSSKVKPSVNALMLMDQVTDSEHVLNGLQVKQLPYVEGEENQWMAADFEPDPEQEPEQSNTSFVFISSGETIDLENNISGIVISDWDEIIPFKKVDTGVAFNYDAPNSKSPKNILLGVSPDLTGKWNWEDLLGIVNEATALAKVRTVTQEDLSKTDLKYFLPATVAPVYEDDSNPGLDFLKNNKNG